jgi:hypothetical protein
MNNVIIDDRRIRCDFSQSVMKEWKQCAARPRLPPLFELNDAKTATGTACSCARKLSRRGRSVLAASTSVAACS